MKRATRYLLIALPLAVAFVVALAATLLGTEAGTRWVFARAAGSLPVGIELGAAEGTFLRGLEIESVRVRMEGVDLETGRIVFDVELLPLLRRRITIPQIDVARIDLQLTSTESAADSSWPVIDLPVDLEIGSGQFRNVFVRSGQTERTIDRIALSATLLDADLSLTRLVVDSDWIELDAEGNARLASDYAANLRIRWRFPLDEDSGALAGELVVNGDRRRGYDAEHILNEPFAANTSGRISVDNDVLAADLRTTWNDLELTVAESDLSSTSGRLALAGTVDQVSITLETAAQIDNYPEVAIALNGGLTPDILQIDALDLQVAGGQLALSGQVGLAGAEFATSFEFVDVDLAEFSDSIAGRVSATGEANGQLADDPAIDIVVSRLDGLINEQPLSGSMSAAYAGGVTEVTNGRLQLGSNRLVATGRLGNDLNVTGRLDAPALEELLPGAKGSLHGQVTASGTSTQPQVRASIAGASVAWQDLSVRSISAEVDIQLSADSQVDLNAEGLLVGDNAIDGLGVSATGQLDQHDVTINVQAMDAELRGAATGGYSEDSWRGKVTLLEVAHEALGSWTNDGPSELRAAAGSAFLERTCLAPSATGGRACLQFEQESTGSSLDLDIEDLPLDPLRPLLPAGLSIGGFAQLQIDARIADARISGNSLLELSNTVLETNYDGENLTADFSTVRSEADIVDNALRSKTLIALADGTAGANLDLQIDDIADPDSALAGTGSIRVDDAAIFAVLVPQISDPSGRIGGTLQVTGSLGRPDFVGEIALTEAAFGVRPVGIRVTDIEARLRQHAAGQLEISGSAKSGNGSAILQGQARVGTETGARAEVSLTGEDFELARLPDWKIAASPDIELVFDDRVTTVNGEIAIPRADISIKEIPDSAISPSSDATVHRKDSTPENRRRRVNVDVRAALGDDVRLAAFGLTTAISGGVQISGGSHEPFVGNGRLSLKEGEYKMYGQALAIERGELIFSGPLDNPTLDVRAVRQIDDVTAGIQLSGTATRLQSDVFSEPALSDAETLSYLLTGRPLSRAADADDGNALTNAAYALGLSGAGPVTSQIRSSLGLETLTVEGGADSGRIVAGKRFGDRLLVEYGYGLVDKLGSLLLRYQLSDRLILESRTGSVSNLDLIYSVKKN